MARPLGIEYEGSYYHITIRDRHSRLWPYLFFYRVVLSSVKINRVESCILNYSWAHNLFMEN